MSDAASSPSRKSVSLPAALWAQVDSYRFDNRIGTEAEALRRLIELGLQTTKVSAIDVHLAAESQEAVLTFIPYDVPSLTVPRPVLVQLWHLIERELEKPVPLARRPPIRA